MNILNKKFYEKDHYWYRQGNRIVWWDRSLKLWSTFLIDSEGNQITDVEYANNKIHFRIMEEKGFFDKAEDYMNYLEITWDKNKYSNGVK